MIRVVQNLTSAARGQDAGRLLHQREAAGRLHLLQAVREELVPHAGVLVAQLAQRPPDLEPTEQLD
jgi:hypothetical protein